MISKILDRYTKWRDRCRSCEVDGIHKSLIDAYDTIREVSHFKTVIEYRCDKCETLWILAEKAEFINKVVRTELYAKWKSQSWLPTSSQMAVLNKIVGARDYYGKNMYFPCEVRQSNGLRVKKAIITATTGDCFGRFPLDQEVIILDDSYRISPSDYALPADVRAATMIAVEKSMGYAPVNVKDINGKQYTLSNQMHFFEVDGIRGPDIALDDASRKKGNIVHPDCAEMYLICDMFDCNTATTNVNRTFGDC